MHELLALTNTNTGAAHHVTEHLRLRCNRPYYVAMKACDHPGQEHAQRKVRDHQAETESDETNFDDEDDGDGDNNEDASSTANPKAGKVKKYKDASHLGEEHAALHYYISTHKPKPGEMCGRVYPDRALHLNWTLPVGTAVYITACLDGADQPFEHDIHCVEPHNGRATPRFPRL